MASCRWLVLTAFVMLTSFPAAAVDNRVFVTDIAALKSGMSAGAPAVSVSCYHSVATNVICAGGGDFDGASCGSDVNNDATIIKDTVDNLCYYRKNFGLNGVVDARQCGVFGDGVGQDAVALQKCLDLAKTYNIPVVSTGGGRVRDDQVVPDGYGQDIKIPGGVTLSCGGDSALGQVSDNNYTNTVPLGEGVSNSV